MHNSTVSRYRDLFVKSGKNNKKFLKIINYFKFFSDFLKKSKDSIFLFIIYYSKSNVILIDLKLKNYLF